MTISQLITRFNNQAYSRPWRDNSIINKRVQKILSLVGSNQRVLDIGCYDGTISRLITSHGNRVVGLDISSPAISMAKKKGIEAYVHNIEDQPIPKKIGLFDLVLAGEIIEHIFDPDAFLKRVRAVLKPNGHLILTTPNLAGLGSRLSLFFGRLPWMIENDLLPGKSGHIRYFTFTELQKLLTRNGFNIVEFTTDSVGLNQSTLPFMGKALPTLGRILIIKAQKI